MQVFMCYRGLSRWHMQTLSLCRGPRLGTPYPTYYYHGTATRT